MSRHSSYFAAAVLGLTLFALPSFADEHDDYSGSLIRDVYDRPGFDPYRQMIDENVEHIDPFTGQVQYQHIDLVVPGNGGLDIVVQRSYASVRDTLGPINAIGVGWNLHFGRVLIADLAKLCSPIWGVHVHDNPVLETPDGRSRLLVYPSDHSFLYITSDQWRGECVSGLDTGLIVTDPTGVRYTMNQLTSYANMGPSNTSALYASRIEDPNGNWIEIDYLRGGASGAQLLVERVRASDGRLVEFSYRNPGTDQVTLASIEADERTWSYTHQSAPGGFHHNLTAVERPDSTRWEYEYFGSLPFGTAGRYNLRKVIYPQGGTIEYDYQYSSDNYGADFPFIRSRTVSGRDATSGQWVYTRSATPTGDYTEITGPEGTRWYRHWGTTAAAHTFGTLYAVGVLLEMEVRDLNGVLVHAESYGWQPRKVSDENYWIPSRPVGYITPAYYAPVMSGKSYNRDGIDGWYSTVFEDHDVFGNARRIIEEGTRVRITNRTFLNDTTRWIVHTVKDETIDGIGTIQREFDSRGNLLSEDRYGVPTAFAYHPTGDLHTVTDTLGRTTRYTDHRRGIARTETLPDGATILRTVDDAGRIITETDPRGHTTRFSHDPMGRITRVDHPAGLPLTVNYRISQERSEYEAARGDYRETGLYDGFGRLTRMERNGIRTTFGYDSLGRRTFTSHPGSSLGMTTHYDPIGRITRIVHADGSERHFDHEANVLYITDERGQRFQEIHMAFGDPDETWLTAYIAPHIGTTTLGRNSLGLITSVRQSAQLTRTYDYDSRYFLMRETHPETGITEYGRDAVGNMISRQVNGAGTLLFQYDAVDRLVAVDYPDDTPPATYLYDPAGNLLSADNGLSLRTYTYDPNNNLASESVRISGESFEIRYAHNGLDHLEAIEYPDGRQISYAPDPLGRPTRIGDFVAAITYHPDGQPHTLAYANGVATTLDQDPERLWLAGIRVAGSGGALLNLDYDHDPAGNVTRIQNILEPVHSHVMSYDGVGRMTAASGPWGSGSYTYDVVSNIVSQTLGTYRIDYGYDINANRLAWTLGSEFRLFGYDPHGNITQNGPFAYRYDATDALREGRVLVHTPDGAEEITIAAFGYDADGRRVVEHRPSTDDAEARNTMYLYTRDNRLLAEYHDDGRRRDYVYLDHSLIAAVDVIAAEPPDPTDPPPAPGDPSARIPGHVADNVPQHARDRIPAHARVPFLAPLRSAPAASSTGDPSGRGIQAQEDTPPEAHTLSRRPQHAAPAPAAGLRR